MQSAVNTVLNVYATHLLRARVFRYFLSSSIGSLVALAMSIVVYVSCWLNSIKMHAWRIKRKSANQKKKYQHPKCTI